MNSLKDIDYKNKFVSGCKKFAKVIAGKRSRLKAKRKIRKEKIRRLKKVLQNYRTLFWQQHWKENEYWEIL